MSAAEVEVSAPARSSPAQVERFRSINRELLIVFLVFLVSAILNLVFSSQRMVLGLYLLPTIYSAYHYGRRHAVLTAVLSAFLVVLLAIATPGFTHDRFQMGIDTAWSDIAAWSGLLLVIAYAVGTLQERNQSALADLRASYRGILLILQHITCDQKYSQNHPYRVSMCATQIAEEMNLPSERVEDVRSCALLHEIEKVGISRDLLRQAAGLGSEKTEAEVESRGGAGTLRRIVKILGAFEQASNGEAQGQQKLDLPLEARILQVADVYDSLTSAREARISPSEAMERIAQRAGLEYDSEVVEAFIRIFRRRAAGAV